jgi:hypothetical protein
MACARACVCMHAHGCGMQSWTNSEVERELGGMCMWHYSKPVKQDLENDFERFLEILVLAVQR